MSEKHDTARNRSLYEASMHAVQTGVKLQIARDGVGAAGADAKHLRVGINSAMVEHSALVALLIERGVFTDAEYVAALAAAAEKEHARFEALLGVRLA